MLRDTAMHIVDKHFIPGCVIWCLEQDLEDVLELFFLWRYEKDPCPALSILRAPSKYMV